MPSTAEHLYIVRDAEEVIYSDIAARALAPVVEASQTLAEASNATPTETPKPAHVRKALAAEAIWGAQTVDQKIYSNGAHHLYATLEEDGHMVRKHISHDAILKAYGYDTKDPEYRKEFKANQALRPVAAQEPSPAEPARPQPDRFHNRRAGELSVSPRRFALPDPVRIKKEQEIFSAALEYARTHPVSTQKEPRGPLNGVVKAGRWIASPGYEFTKLGVGLGLIVAAAVGLVHMEDNGNDTSAQLPTHATIANPNTRVTPIQPGDTTVTVPRSGAAPKASRQGDQTSTPLRGSQEVRPTDVIIPQAVTLHSLRGHQADSLWAETTAAVQRAGHLSQQEIATRGTQTFIANAVAKEMKANHIASEQQAEHLPVGFKATISKSVQKMVRNFTRLVYQGRHRG